MPKKINPKIIRYVEKTEGKKFIRTPTLVTRKIYGGENEATVIYNQNGKNKVTNARVALSPRLAKRGNDWGKVVLVHELRENLNNQHHDYTERQVHQKALKYEKADKTWLHRQGITNTTKFGPVRKR